MDDLHRRVQNIGYDDPKGRGENPPKGRNAIGATKPPKKRRKKPSRRMFSPAKIDNKEEFFRAQHEHFYYYNKSLGIVRYQISGENDDMMVYHVSVFEPYKGNKDVDGPSLPQWGATVFIFKRPCARLNVLQKFFNLDQPEQVIAMHEGFTSEYLRRYKCDYVLNGLESYGFKPYDTF